MGVPSGLRWDGSPGYALLDADESELLGCVCIDPPRETGESNIGAVVSRWVVDRAVGTDLERALDEFVPGWVRDTWRFRRVEFSP